MGTQPLIVMSFRVVIKHERRERYAMQQAQSNTFSVRIHGNAGRTFANDGSSLAQAPYLLSADLNTAHGNFGGFIKVQVQSLSKIVPL